MTKLPGAKPSPRIAGGVLRWYAGDTFSVTLALELRDQDKSFSRKLKSYIQGISHQVDHNDACKTQDTSDHLSSCHTLLTENKTG